jgi:hypothetical protein
MLREESDCSAPSTRFLFGVFSVYTSEPYSKGEDLGHFSLSSALRGGE